MVRVKKKVTTKSVGLSKNGKSGERRSTVHSRTVPYQSKAIKKTKDDDAHNDAEQNDTSREGRSEIPSHRDSTERGNRSKSRKKDGRRTITVTAPVPASYRSNEKDRNGISEMHTETSDACIDLDELAKVEIDNEKGSNEYSQNEVGIAETSSSTNKSSINSSSNISATEATFDGNNQFDVDALKDTTSKSIKSALNTMDAAIYALGRFVGEKTCHEPSFDTCISVNQTPNGNEKSNENDECPTYQSEVETSYESEDVKNSEIVGQSSDSRRVTDSNSGSKST